MNGLYIAETFNTLKEVRRLTEYVFNVLRGGIGGVGKRAEGGGVGKILIAEFAYIKLNFFARGNIGGGFRYTPCNT